MARATSSVQHNRVVHRGLQEVLKRLGNRAHGEKKRLQHLVSEQEDPCGANRQRLVWARQCDIVWINAGCTAQRCVEGKRQCRTLLHGAEEDYDCLGIECARV